ncbi:hypothetical protein SAE02_75280 [Skermanella aerolata]|uniref:histidine kinase n=1 Tax=Skermanella aerolata TaxID=393310 RepID=A0A512E4I2_9PROT|nr:CHASE4 domain-containing protein [Skermanella aerolata]KJB90238.1 hypothetical protein N826_04510 [Skermanella aerolata KACC 11604]GEO43380.1 hypothetical protein SAE02_75280 [Skermanella aerolata]
MRLIHRVILILAAATAVLVIGNTLILHLIVATEFRTLESTLAVRNADRAVDAIAGNLAQLKAAALDWARWDSSYDFMRGQHVEEFISQNLVPQSFSGIQVNLMYFVRRDGTVTWGGTLDPATGHSIDPAGFLSDRLPADRMALFTQEQDGQEVPSGILMTDKGPLLVAAVPILRANGSGPDAGLLILGRFLDDTLVDQLGQQVHTRFTLAPVGSGASAAGVLQEPTGELVPRDASAEREETRITVEDDHLSVDVRLRDMAGNPVLVLKTSYSRRISAAGTGMVNLVLGLMTAVLAATGLAMLAMLNRTVVRPVATLLERVLEVRGAAVRCGSNTLVGEDEITVLGREFEETLRQLEETRNRLIEQSFYTGAAELVSGMTHNVRNALTPISIKLWNIGRALDRIHLDRMASVVERLAAGTADREDCVPATAYLTACVDNLHSSHDAIRADLAVIGDQTTHIEQVFQDHERFSRAERRIETIDLAWIVEEAVRLLQHGEAVSLSVLPDVATLPPVRGHAVILTQVFGNLVVNAEEAVLNAGRGTGTITVDGGVVDHNGVDMIEVRFSDDGQGIAPDRLDRIFERGYSTRRNGSGGIGLHWCANSLAGMGGSIEARSNGIGHGATLVVRLPVQEKTFSLDSTQQAPEQVRHS